jgi:integrase/recombinase XerC
MPKKRSKLIRRPYYSSNGVFDESKYLSEQEYKRLHGHLENLKENDTRNVALIFTAMYTGARASEVLNIRFQDLNPNLCAVKIFGIKDSNDRVIPIPQWLFQLISALPRITEHPFDITYPRLDQIWRGYRTTKKKFHALRHTFAIRLYRRTKDLRLVQKALGHRSVSNTLIYLEYVHNQEDMQKILE